MVIRRVQDTLACSIFLPMFTDSLSQAVTDAGFILVPVDAEQMRLEKQQDRLRDAEQVASGAVTADAVQQRNALVRGKIRVLDWSAAFRR